ncbi:hypothetical protein E3T55_11760 [Cryobacterium frigoriphilum]|uniref:PH domain-containing protein n=1 Tax=Cryobacterium frigoriphilum TaxID=1259150 RepID=A0A4R8ZYU3_9MICO|nr:STM3941 family protein [Cryobacterium frigoriphilum]TFD49141.1 hypothetical protein E3T55_11760 [Cryobacterium frigoriphilum]
MRSPTPSPAGLPVVSLTASKRKLTLVVLGCAAFAVVGAFMLASDPNLYEAVIAVAAIVFFGGGGIFFLIKAPRAGAVLVMTLDGFTVWSGGFVPWVDLESVGIARASRAKVVGFRLRSYDSYIASLTGRVTAGQLAWARQHTGGYDLTLPALLFDRPASRVVTAVEEYYAAWAAQADDHGERRPED